MKRKWNWPIWVGFIIAGSGLCSYAFFAQNLTENIALRARPEQVLNAFDDLRPPGSD